jgi:hypothetical protein
MIMKVLGLPIEMIAWFNEGGVPTPMKFKMNRETPPLVIKVDKVISKEVEKFAGNQMYLYRCQSFINDLERVYELKYEVRTCKWMLFKM